MLLQALKNIRRFFRGDELVANREEVARQNRLALHYFAATGVPVGIANIAAQSIITGEPHLGLRSCWLLGYFTVLALLDRFVIPQHCKRATLLAYLADTPVMLVSILLGTIWDPSHQAITFLLFMVIVPVFILDRPLRLMGTTLGWCVLFALLCVATKEPKVVQADLMHTLEFYLSSSAVLYVVLRLRLEVLQSLERTRYHLEHDVITDTRNRRCLDTHANGYLHERQFVAIGKIDHFTLLNDFYGHDMGDSLLLTFANTLKSLFGEQNTYRYGGDEILCIMPCVLVDNELKLIASCQEQLGAYRSARMYSQLTCSFGYVVGKPASKKELEQMIQLADIYAHQSSRQGEGKTVGGPFDAEALRAGIVESNISTHARAYEINQLTGLPSMAYFIARSDELLHHVADIDRHPVVGFFNLMHFRDFNDTHGYQRGDELIKYIADLLRTALPKRHIAYITGSQFGVLCYRDEIEPTMALLVNGLQDQRHGHAIEVKAGFVAYHPGDSVISLLDKAKLAYANVTELRGVSWRMYDQQLDEEIRFRQYLISHVDEAIEHNWIKVYYQPIVRTATGEACNYEALSRWDDPTYGFLPPFKFISVLEKERLIYKLSLHVVKRILQDFKILESRGIPLVPVSVNLSRSDFFECDIVEEICSLVDAAGYSHQLLNIEITESAFADDQGALKDAIDRLRAHGFAVWMDDFGSEYSTLNLLENLNFDLIKVDMQFMRNLTSNARNAIILADILNMCQHLGIVTLVEGIETPEHYDILRTLGADKLQGYLFSQPRPFDELFAQR